jgi:hypothetical protein
MDLCRAWQDRVLHQILGIPEVEKPREERLFALSTAELTEF